MILEQYYLGCLSHASYLIANEDAGVACIVDPQRDVDRYLERAAELGVEIRHVALTHFHADFVAGHLELRKRTGARIHLGRAAAADYDFEPWEDGEELVLGTVRLRALETPGHTPESISILVYEREGADPHAVLTGDTLFIGDVGRPDLMASIGITAEELAAQMFDSLHGKLLALPDETLVYPAHGAGSMCGKNLSTDTVSTIGQQRRFNYALQPMSREDFVRMVTANQPDAPAYFPYDATLNRSERGLLDETLERTLRPLTADEVIAHAEAGAQVLDTRTADAFAQAHLAGSVHVGLDGRFATWAGTVLETDRDIVLVTEPGTEREAALRLGRVGFDRVAGYLEGGFAALADRQDKHGRVERIETTQLARLMVAGSAPHVLDVRTAGEHCGGHIEGAQHVPLRRLVERADEIPRDRTVYVHCLSGYRSSTAISLLQARGFTQLVDVVGGMEAWSAANLPTVSPETSAT